MVMMNYRSTICLKKMRNVAGPRHPGIIGDRGSGSFSRESSSAAEWSKEADFPDWFDQDFSDSECGQSQQSSSCSHLHQQHISTLAAGPQSPYVTADLSTLSNSNVHLPGLPHGLHYGGNMSQLNNTGLSLNNRLQSCWTSHTGLIHGDHSSLINSILPHHFPHQNRLSHQIMSPQQLQQQKLHLAVQPSLGQFSALQSQLCNSFPFPSHLRKYGSGDYRNPRSKSSHKG
ncbi:putative 4-hydroxyphenylpyruvate dioxygenase-like [Capsicum annuum]|nr:putative 4-hydroxyphenylpyruvate dioxygenase-like [Capsicum annuum]